MKNKERKKIFIFVTYFTMYTDCMTVYEIRDSHKIVVNRLYRKIVKNLKRTTFYPDLYHNILFSLYETEYKNHKKIHFSDMNPRNDIICIL